MRLFDFEVRRARVVLRSIVPASTLGGVTAELDLGERFAREHDGSPWQSAALMRFALWLVWLAPLVMLKGLHTFGGLEEAARVEVIERLLHMDAAWIRLAATFLKLTACVLALGDRRALERLDAYGLGAAAKRQAS